MENHLKHIAVPDSEITPERAYVSRRDFLKAMGILTAGAWLAACTPKSIPAPAASVQDLSTSNQVDELENTLNSYEQITGYNNYYEFTTDQSAVAELARDFKTSPWNIEVGGQVQRPRIYGMEDLLKFKQKERIYRMRCVEGWSMVIPWLGFELGDLLREVEPKTSAKYVRFTTLMDTEQMPGEASSFYPWPYREGLRLDEAMHRLTLLATGLYGHSLPNQNGAPTRLVVPWKYGFKSIKAIVKIELTEAQPETFWSSITPREYGFYSNVNPNVDHPRWSQKTERRIGELNRRETLMFNGYGEEVTSLYTGMDLRDYY